MSAPRRNLRVDVVHANPKGGTRKILDTARCPLCPPGKARFVDGDAVLRIRDFGNITAEPVGIHRRCVEALLAVSAEDEPREISKFERYRRKVAADLGLSLPVG